MKNFWPPRPSAKGFSIERLALKYRERLSKKVSSSNFSKNESPKEITSNIVKIENKEILKSQIYANSIHWANRDFSEYRDAA